jgi:hypothetical protein
MNRFILATGLATALMVAVSGGSFGGVAATAPAAQGAIDGTTGTSLPEVGRPQRIEIAFVLDTTGSMSGLIDGAKRRIWGIADAVRKLHPQAEIRVGLVGYRDRGDARVTDVTDLSSDIGAVYGKLLEFRAQGGGDWPESVNEALSVAVGRLDWTKGETTRKLIFLVGDAPPHMDYVQDVPFADTLKIAEAEGIVVDALQCGAAADTELAWKTIAQLGRGRYAQIPQEGGVAQISTPWDDAIVQIQIRLNRTIIPYGSQSRQGEVRHKAERAASAPAAAASDMASYNTRAASPAERVKVVTGEGDLVADVAAGKAAAETVKRDDLPEDYRRLSTEALKAEIEKQRAERGRLQSDLAGLVAKRDGAIAAARAARTAGRDGFDVVVEEMLAAQVR